MAFFGELARYGNRVTVAPQDETGLPDHRDSVLTQDERRTGDCMVICVSRSCTERLVLDL